MHRPENIEKQEESGSGSVTRMLERHLVKEFRLIEGIRDNLGVTAIVV